MFKSTCHFEETAATSEPFFIFQLKHVKSIDPMEPLGYLSFFSDSNYFFALKTFNAILDTIMHVEALGIYSKNNKTIRN